jgi:hypothetical protein
LHSDNTLEVITPNGRRLESRPWPDP